MNKRRNYRILWWALILGSIILDLVGTRMDQGARDVLRYVGAAMLAVGVVPLVVRAKPKVMEDKPPALSGQE